MKPDCRGSNPWPGWDADMCEGCKYYDECYIVFEKYWHRSKTKQEQPNDK